MKYQQIPLSELTPSQFMVKKRLIEELRNTFEEESMDPVPVKKIDGEYIITDGHHRACVMDLLGFEKIPTIHEDEELNWEAYRINVKDCKERNVNTLKDLKKVQVNENIFKQEWVEYWDSVHEKVKGVIIRKATTDDAEHLGYIHSRSWRNAYKGIIPDEMLNNCTPQKSAERFLRVLEKASDEESYLLLKNSMPLGFISLGHCDVENIQKTLGEIVGIYLLPEFWGQGVGRTLMEYGITELKRQGYSLLCLWVPEENIAARKFYEKLGFKTDGARKNVQFKKKLPIIRYMCIIK